MRFFLIIMLAILSAPALAQDVNVMQSPDMLEEPVSQEKELGDVRGFVWGLGAVDIQAYEEAEFLGINDHVLSFKGKDHGLDAYIDYYFFDGKLGRAEVTYTQKRTEPQVYLDDYIELQDKMNKERGQATQDQVIWKRSIYRDDPERWGLAAMMGFVEFTSVWVTPSSAIRLVFDGYDVKARMKMVYSSDTIVDVENQPSLVPKR